MIRQIALVIFVAVVLLGLVLYSQIRPQPQYVSGWIEADEIRLGSRVGGRVRAIHVKEGERVAAGNPLIEFEAYDLKEREQQAIAILAEREAALREVQTGLRAEEIRQAQARYQQALAELSLIREGPRQEEIEAAERRLEAAMAEWDLSKNELQRVEDLRQKNAVAQKAAEEASERLDVAQATVGVRENELKVLRAGARQQEIAIAEARVEDLRLAWELAKQGSRAEVIEQATAARDAAQAAVEAIRRQEQELTVRAPTGGTIDALDLQPGDLVPPNAPFVSMLSEQELWIRAYVPQRFLQLEVGQDLRVTVDSYPGEEFRGELTFISRQAEFTPSNVQTPDDRARQVYRIRVRLEEATGRLRPGMTANVWLNEVEPGYE